MGTAGKLVEMASMCPLLVTTDVNAVGVSE